jgi:hypothetical protein
MNPSILKFTRHFLTVLLITLTGLSASAIVSHSRKTPQTPTINREFETQVRKFLGPDTGKAVDYEKSELTYFSAYFFKNADLAWQELAEGIWAHDPRGTWNITEFRHLQADLVRRGYEPFEGDREKAELDGKMLLLYYGPHKVGPTKDEDAADGYKYTHDLEFSYDVGFKPQGQELKSQDSYPQASLHGYVYLSCKKEFADCKLTSVSVIDSRIQWETVPGPRGGNSSAGGGPRASSSDFLSKAALSKQEVEKIKNDQKSR